MTMVTEYDWESDTFTHHAEHAARQAWREAVTVIAEKARETLPDCAGRVDRAVQIVLNHDVELLEDGQARVASQSSGEIVYHLVNGACTCKDFVKAPSGWCKHRIAAGLYKRATALVQRQLHGASNGQDDGAPVLAPAPVAEAAAAPTHGIPPQHVVMIQGKPFVKFSGLLQLAHSKGLESLSVDWTYNDAALSLAHAVAVFPFGRYGESGDATPENVSRKVAPHFRRVALTRALARCLRHALNVDLVSVEELGED